MQQEAEEDAESLFGVVGGDDGATLEVDEKEDVFCYDGRPDAAECGDGAKKQPNMEELFLQSTDDGGSDEDDDPHDDVLAVLCSLEPENVTKRFLAITLGRIVANRVKRKRVRAERRQRRRAKKDLMRIEREAK